MNDFLNQGHPDHENGTGSVSALELLADAALFGVDEVDPGAFNRAVDALGFGEYEMLELAAAELVVAGFRGSPAANGAGGGGVALPASVRSRCLAAYSWHDRDSDAGADAWMPLGAPPAPIRFGVEPKGNAGRGGVPVGWLAAAAAVALAALGWLRPASGPAAGLVPGSEVALTSDNLASARDAMVTAGATQIDWAPWGEVAQAELGDVSGTVVWDEDAQAGYMTFRNLPANDPSEMRYQLWIVDASRGVPLTVPPVDGGVFDVSEAMQTASGEVIVPIRAKLPVGEAAIFAVTREGPDGVVVSERRPDQMVVVAMNG